MSGTICLTRGELLLNKNLTIDASATAGMITLEAGSGSQGGFGGAVANLGTGALPIVFACLLAEEGAQHSLRG